MPTLNINGEVINFPEVNASPNWAPAIVQFAQATEAALNTIVVENDIAPYEQSLVTFLSPTVILESLIGLIFPRSDIYSFKIEYHIKSTKAGPVSLRETGTLEGITKSNGDLDLVRSADTDIGAVFSVDSTTGQVSISNPLTGTEFTSASIAYRATVVRHVV
jgi:hypothetical protein